MGFAEGDLKEIEVVSSADGSEEKSIFFKLGGKQPRPLIVCLHPWSASMEHQVEEIVPLARETGCNAVFQGSNRGFGEQGGSLACKKY